jgi:phage terminase large subunit
MYVIQTIQKLKAAMKAVIGADKDLIKKTKKHYFNDILIYSDSEDERFYTGKSIKENNLFANFLDTDYRADMKDNDADLDYYDNTDSFAGK